MNKHPVLHTTLSILLVVILSTFIAALVFSIVASEKRVQRIVDDGGNQIISNQVDLVFSEVENEQLFEQHTAALTACETKKEVVVGDDGEGGGLLLNCDNVRGTTQEAFLTLLKEELQQRGRAQVSEMLGTIEENLKKFRVAAIALGILSLLLFVGIIGLAGKIPFVTMGVVFMASGFPFVFVLFSSTFVVGAIEEGLNQQVPQEVRDTIPGIEDLQEAVFNLIGEFLHVLFLVYLSVFILGFALLVIGLSKRKREK